MTLFGLKLGLGQIKLAIITIIVVVIGMSLNYYTPQLAAQAEKLAK